jgi:hypothetical protein
MPLSSLTLRALITAAGVVAVLALGAASPALADECPNAALRAQNNSSELPDCRAYELVTPSYKEGFSFSPQGFSDDAKVSFWSTGNFAGNQAGGLYNQYVSSREAAGWLTQWLGVPTDQYTPLFGPLGAEGLSADLQTSLWTMRATSDADWTYYVRRPGGAFTRIGRGTIPGLDNIPYTIAVSTDLSHVIFAHGSTGSGSPALAALYEYVGTDNNDVPRPVSVDNNGHQMDGEPCFKAMSTDARVIFFACSGDSGRLWARVDGSATVNVAGSECTRTAVDIDGACNDGAQADYAGSAVDGSRVFFTTTQQLVNRDTDQTSDVYACDIPSGAPTPVGTTNSCASLTKVSVGSASGARVERVAAVSDDGSRVYFVARGVLADNLGTNDAAAVDEKFNLYLWTKDAVHPAGQIRFVTELSGNDLLQPQMTPDGRYLVFGTASALITSGAGADSDSDSLGQGHIDVYRYDAYTQGMVRLSTAAAGGAGNGPFDVTINTPAKGRSATVVTADGSTVVFQTDEALSARDTDRGPDVYSWHDGRVALISDGIGGGSFPWISPSGRDILFLTGQHLTTTDGDGIADIYDAREGGGFDLRQPTPCSGDGCQGERRGPPNLLGPSPAAGVLGGAGVVPSLSLRTVSAAQRKRLAATGKLTLTVSSNAGGVVRAAATVVLAGRPVVVAAARHAMAAAGTTTLTLSLSERARGQFAARGKLTVKVVVRHSRVALDRSVTLQLIHTKAKSVKRSSATGRGSRS